MRVAIHLTTETCFVFGLVLRRNWLPRASETGTRFSLIAACGEAVVVVVHCTVSGLEILCGLAVLTARHETGSGCKLVDVTVALFVVHGTGGVLVSRWLAVSIC